MEYLGKIKIDLVLESGQWEEIFDPDAREVWKKKVDPIGVETYLLGRHYLALWEDDLNPNEDLDDANLYAEDGNAQEEELEAINLGLRQIANEHERDLKSSAIGVSQKHGLVWVQGTEGTKELQLTTLFESRIIELLVHSYSFEEIAEEVTLSISIEDLESAGWLHG